MMYYLSYSVNLRIYLKGLLEESRYLEDLPYVLDWYIWKYGIFTQGIIEGNEVIHNLFYQDVRFSSDN